MKKFIPIVQQIRVLLWKGFIVRLRHPFYLAVEFLSAMLLTGMVIYGKRNIHLTFPNYNETVKPGQPYPTHFGDIVDYDLKTAYINLTIPFMKKSIPLHYAPDNDDTKQIMSRVESIIKEISPKSVVQCVPSASEEELTKIWFNTSTLRREAIPGYIVFTNLSGLTMKNGTFEVKLLQSGLKFPDLYRLWKGSLGPSGEATDYNKGFLQLQHPLNEAYLSIRRKNLGLYQILSSNITNFKTRRMPYPYHKVVAFNYLHDKVPTAIAYGLSVSFAYLIYRTCSEKATGSKEMLTMAGMSLSSYWIASFIMAYVFMSVISCVELALMFVRVEETSNFFLNSSISLISCLVNLYVIQLILFSFFLTTLFTRPVIATCVSLTIFLFSFTIPDNVLNDILRGRVGIHERRLTCLLPNAALVSLFRIISNREIIGFGLEWNSIHDHTEAYDGLTALDVSLVMFFSCFVYIILIWYLDQVWPWQPGVKKHFLFPFSKDYWFPTLQRLSARTQSTTSYNGEILNEQFFEEEPHNIPKAIECTKLVKRYSTIFPRRINTAVNHIDINVYHGSITCLLGHNGAGKTTTMNMITGMDEPTRGMVKVNGFDLHRETAQARSKLSFCPQHNSVYDDLTITQHLYLYAAIKGCPQSEISISVRDTIESLGLKEHRNKLPHELSGGMKRKLCLAIAIVGGSQIIVLDEPSSGLDTEARRAMWDVLKKIRNFKTILMTTHDMEEADALADRIIVMHSGKIVCSGSSMFLKKVLCGGYILKVLKSRNFQPQLTLNLIRQFLPKAEIKAEIATEISYKLNEDENSEYQLPISSFFEELEKNKDELGIESFGVTASTMEEVFLSIGDKFDTETESSELSASSMSYVTNSCQSLQMLTGDVSPQFQYEFKSGLLLLITQFYALFIKRLNHAKRSWLMLMFQILLPSFIIFLAFLITNPVIEFPFHSNSLTISMGMYSRKNLPVLLVPETHGKIFLKYNQSDDSLHSFAQSFQKIVESSGFDYSPIESSENVKNFLEREVNKTSFTDFMETHIIGFELNKQIDGNLSLLAWINGEASHSLPLSLQILAEARDMQLTGINSMTLKNSIIKSQDTRSIKLIPSTSIIWLLLFSLSITFIGASYVLFPISERASKSKLIQLMTGLNSGTLHFVSFVFDWMSHIIATICMLLVVYLSDLHDTLVPFDHNFTAMFLLLVTFGACAILFAYITSFTLNVPSFGFVYIQIVYCISGPVFGILASTLELYMEKDDISPETFSQILWFLRLSPVFCISWAFRKIYSNGVFNNVCSTLDKSKNSALRKFACQTFGPVYHMCCEDTCKNYKKGLERCIYSNPFGLSGNRIGNELIMLFVEMLLLTLVLIIAENYYKIRSRFGRKDFSHMNDKLDDDVIAEKDRVETLVKRQQVESSSLVIQNLKKKHSKSLAVRGINLAIQKSECFGLLGVNGAGKSTTFGMITGDLLSTSGNVFQGKLEVSRDTKEYQRNIGYCPQFDPLLDNLTGLETMYLIGRLRGISERFLPNICDEMTRLVHLQRHINKPTSDYSGGNKRKLSIALAMLGNPQILLLDEPTAGVDPASRRRIWSTLSQIQETYNCSIILTSHSMDECEALCSRIAIMVNGQFVCLGSPQRLRLRFGQGFTLHIKFKKNRITDEKYFESFEINLKKLLKEVHCIDHHDVVKTYKIAQDSSSWSQMFNAMEQLKKQFDLEDYSLSDTTLEQIFIHFAKTQNEASTS